jgi:putative phosphoesterase
MTAIGLISDIHADLERLIVALDFLRGRGVDHIICAGDLLEKGRQGDAVVARIRAERIPCVQGNHDHNAQGTLQWLSDLVGEELLRERGSWLEAETLAFAQELPQHLRFEWDGVRVYLTHGAPWDIEVYVWPNSPMAVFERVIAEASADIVILGHTHKPTQITLGGTLIVNPGAVCERLSTCAILTLPERTFEVFALNSGERLTPGDGSLHEW